jgi:dihydrofolate synthase/folylpolyglutamate synthase
MFVPAMDYEDALRYLSSLEFRGWRLGLDRMRELVRRAGIDDALGACGNPRFVHIAGTNGKGSVAAYVQSALHRAGYRVGGYFSPYVYDVRERIQLGCAPISRQDMARLIAELRPAAESFEGTELGGITEFELKTALGFAFWRQMECEWVALEVGMGGRLDATNVVTPACAVIVSIGLDHTAHLGPTHASIAGEKAGIIKAGAPAVLGQVPPDALAPILSAAKASGSQVWRFGAEVRLERGPRDDGWTVSTPVKTIARLSAGIPGAPQPHNMAVAVASMHAAGIAIDDEALREGLARAALPGRFEQRRVGEVDVILDGAHNAEAAELLAETTQAAFPGRKAVLLTGMLDGHDPVRFYRALASIVREAHAAPIAFRRALPAETVAAELKDAGVDAIAHSDAHRALDAALSACSEGEPMLVTGSFYLVGEIGRLLSARGPTKAPACQT